MKTFISLFPDEESAAQVTEALQAAGLSKDRMCVLCRPVEVWQRLGGQERLPVVVRFTLIGSLLGMAIGALYGIPAGIMNCIAMGCSINTSLIFLVVISLFWVLGGAFLGALVGLDRLEQNLYSYVEGVRRGGTLVMVDIPANQTATVTQILNGAHGLLVHDLE